MSSLVLRPLIAPLFVLLFTGTLFLFIGTGSADSIFQFSDTILEKYTYFTYFILFIALIIVREDYQTETEKNTFWFCTFLFFCAVLREAGIQHWLTNTDTTAFKLSFFKNPHNPLGEKVISAYILFIVACVVGILLAHYTPKIIKGFFKFNPLYWTICTLGGTGIVCKIADRLPSNIRKMTGIEMPAQTHALVELLEETTESCLPILCVLALIQYHLMKKKEQLQRQNA